MNYVFEVKDKIGRKIHLSKERWKHIRIYHSKIESYEEIIETIQKPDKAVSDERENVSNFYKYFKHKKQKSKFLNVVVKYLNGEGFVMSAYFIRNIK